jgi:uncharacterized protein YdgA (DUF945 family)
MTTRRLFLYLLLFGTFIWAGPYFMGHFSEQKYHRFIKMVSKMDGIQLKAISYQRHWRHAQARTQVTILAPSWIRLLNQWGATTKPTSSSGYLSFILVHDIQHGPLLQQQPKNYTAWQLGRAQINSRLLIDEKAKSKIEAETGIAELLTVQSEINLTGEITIKLGGESFKLTSQAPTAPPTWQGISAHWTGNNALTAIEGKLQLPGFNFDWFNRHYAAQNCQLKTERSRNSQLGWSGKSHLKMEKFHYYLPEPNAKQLLANDLKLDTVIDKSAQQSQLALGLRIERLEVGKAQYSPIRYQMEIKNLPNLGLKIGSSVKSIDLNAYFLRLNQEFWTEVYALYPMFLKTHPSFKLNNLFIGTEHGNIQGKMNLAITPVKPLYGSMEAQLRQSLNGEAFLQVPRNLFKNWLEQFILNQSPNLNAQHVPPLVRQYINLLIKDGLLKTNDNNFELNLQLRRGHLNVNGNLVPIQKWLNQLPPLKASKVEPE